MPETKQFASVIVRDAQGKYVTLYHYKKSERPWRFAGGKVEPGELPIVAAIRELKEELGLVAKSIKFVTKSASESIDSGLWEGFFYLVEPEDSFLTIMEPDKVSRINLFTADELRENNSHPEYEVVLELERQEELERWNRL